jgi:sialate O-acetylesterase
MKTWTTAIALAMAITASAEVKLPPVISSHMVLQRDMPAPVWGTAAPNEKVTVKFRDQQKETVADGKGNWLVKLDPLKAGGPDVLTVNSVKLDDVLVGEVWVGSGQSNMQMGSRSYVQGDPVLAANVLAAPYPKIRLVRIKTAWAVADKDSLPSFSALLFLFGLRLQKELDVPVGLMVGAVGGTPSGFWLSEEAYRADAACKDVAAKAAATYSPEKAQQAYEQQVAKWEKDVAAAKAKGEARLPRKPAAPVKPGESSGKIGNLYQAHVRPFQPFGIRGVLWDQGESGTAIQDVDQCTLMGALIRGWRQEWGQGDFPFIYIQKPSGNGCAWDVTNPVTTQAQKFEPLPATVPNDGGYVETHIRIMQYPNTAMAISSDLGPNTHPSNKSGYGHRAADVALGMVYGRKIEYYGPLYQSHSVEEGRIRVKFSHVGKGLAFKNGDKLQGFAVAGADKVFHWADAAIDGESVVVGSAAVPKPVAVRYAWANKRTWANLFNQDGLPAVTFRTDDWK